MTTTPERQLPSQPFRFPNRRTALLIAGVLTLGIGAALNWNWLIAAGIRPDRPEYPSLRGHVSARRLPA